MTNPLESALVSLPHGVGFRFIDRLISLEPGRSGTADYRVRGDEPFLAGHFPGEPIFPGVLLVEAGAQLAGIVAQSDPAVDSASRLRLTALRAVKIVGTARPGETIYLQARLLQRLGRLVQAEVTAFVAGQPVMQAQLTLSAEHSAQSPQ